LCPAAPAITCRMHTQKLTKVATHDIDEEDDHVGRVRLSDDDDDDDDDDGLDSDDGAKAKHSPRSKPGQQKKHHPKTSKQQQRQKLGQKAPAQQQQQRTDKKKSKSAAVLAKGWCHYLKHSLKVLAIGEPGDRPWLNVLLVAMPLAFMSGGLGWGNGLTFALALLSMCPFAERLNFVTEDLTKCVRFSFFRLFSFFHRIFPEVHAFALENNKL
jgi:hypothetical protein